MSGQRLPRLAVLWDPPDEGWPSMELSAEMLTAELEKGYPDQVSVQRIQPLLPRWFRRLHVGRAGALLNADRLLGRFGKYPLLMAARRRQSDLFHVSDHSYSQLVHVLPAARTGVYCHDLNTFESVMGTPKATRSLGYRAMAKVTLRGMRKAARIFVSTRQMQSRLIASGWVDPGKVVLAPLGVAPEFLSTVEGLPSGLRSRLEDRRYILHVGSSIPRKRLDVLFDVFSELRREQPDLLLVQVGATLTPAQATQVRTLGLGEALFQSGHLTRAQMAALYRGAALMLFPSDDEGFGLPVIEALACACPVLTSDLPTLREAGGEAVSYCPVGDVSSWASKALALLQNPASGPTAERRAEQAAKYRWAHHARVIWESYRSLL